MSTIIEVGEKIPYFSITDYEGIELESEDLIGSPFVLYFYPKDETPGCIKEACGFRDAMKTFEDHEITVIGVSADSAESHAKFIDNHKLNFTLLCDEDLSLSKKFKAINSQGKGILRSTFIIDSSGIIYWMEQPVNVDGHVERVLEAIKDL